MTLEKFCLTCGKSTQNPKFCSRSCSAVTNNKISPKRRKNHSPCLNCKAECKRSASIYCSFSCSAEHKKKLKLEEWLETEQFSKSVLSSSIRNHLIKQSGHKCSQCGWNKVNPKTGKTPLEVDHIDGNHRNNLISNLRILCPNCHSLTPTYKALNRGNGRPNRRT